MATPLAYFIDTLVLDVYVNHSSLSDQSLPTKIRPYLTICMEPRSRRVLASCLSEHCPDLESIKAILYEAFFADDEDKRSASLPDEIWCDAGISTWPSSLQHLIQALHITLRSTPPSAKGPIERFSRSTQNACFPVQDGSESHLIAESTLSEVKERFAQFLLHYHHQVHSSTGLTPLESWQEQCHPSAVDPQILYLLLHDGGQRHVWKDGIHYCNKVYWHSDLAHYLGKEVHIRVKSIQTAPGTIEVFSKHQWICSAFLQEGTNENHLHNENGGI